MARARESGYINVRAAVRGDLDLLMRQFPSVGRRLHERWLDAQEQGIATYLLGWYGGGLAGRAILIWRPQIGPLSSSDMAYVEIGDVFVVRNSRSLGVGSALMNAAEVLVVRGGRRRIGLAVRVSNRRARSFYAGLGYVEIGLSAVWGSTGWLSSDAEGASKGQVYVFMAKEV